MDQLKLDWNSFIKLILYFIIFLGIYFKILRKWNCNDKKYEWVKQFPTPWLKLPFLGNTHFCLGHPRSNTKVADMFEVQTKKLGPIWTFWEFGKPNVIISDPEISNQVLLSSTNIEKNSNYECVSGVLGLNSLIASPGAQWVHDRKYLQKAFHYDFFNEVVRITNEEGMCLIDRIKSLIGEGKGSFELFGVLIEYVAKISTRSQSKEGVSLSRNDYQTIHHCLDIGRKLTYIYLYLKFLKLSILWWITGMRQVEKRFLCMTSRLVAKFQVAQSNKQDNSVPERFESKPDLWSLVFHSSKSPSWSKDQILTFMAGATDTTSISITMTLFYLATHKECLKKAVEEIDSNFPTSINNIKSNDLKKLKYLEMCWKEAMRLHSPIPLIGRKLSEEVKLADGRYLPAGADVQIYIAGMHRQPNLFEKPNQFIPERFDEFNVKSILPGSYIPFSAGPRNCIGLKTAALEAKLILAQILWSFKVSASQRVESVKSVFMVSSYPDPAIKLKFQCRRKHNECKT